MALFQRLFFAVLLAGLISGAAMAALQQWRIVPQLHAAELYENAAPEEPVVTAHEHEAGTPAHSHEAAAPAHDHGGDEWAPADGIERNLFTIAATAFAAIGFAFVLSAASVLTGFEVTARNGVIWGMAGFAVFQLAPALGLAPELPGMPAADLVARQIWWWGTAIATATAIYGIARFRTWPAIVVGIVLVLLPHIIGAPQLVGEHESAVPAHLATEFAATTLFVGFAFWSILGPLYGYLVERLSQRSAATAPVTA
jgi:cobalt transporter subunit CbtA